MPTTFHGFGFDTIYVLESLPVGHMRTGRDLHDDVLVPLVYGTGVRVEFHVIESAADLTVRLDAIREACLREHRGPIIHLEAHGEPVGVELRNGEFLPWSEFARQMGEINIACGVNLFFVMAACEGGHLASVLDVTDVAYAWGVLGPRMTVYPEPLLEAMTTFYRALLGGVDLRTAITQMNVVSGSSDTYRMTPAELLLFAAFDRYLDLADDANINSRTSVIVAGVVASRGLDFLQSGALRAEVTARMRDHRAEFDRIRTRFLMLDRLPQNAGRFPGSYDELLSARARRRSEISTEVSTSASRVT